MNHRTKESENQKGNEIYDASEMTLGQIWGLALSIFAFGATLLLTVPAWVIEEDLPLLLDPLETGGPVVIVSYGIFMLPTLLIVGILGLSMPPLIIVKRHWPQARSRVESFGKLVLWLGIAGFFWLAIGVPVLGKATEFYVAAQGYEKCDPLTYLEFVAYRPGYVNDPRLCVHHDQINQALQRYGYQPLPGD